MKKVTIVSFLLALIHLNLGAEDVLSLEDCRRMALSGNAELELAQQKLQMSEYDVKIARANYFPKVSAVGTYMYNSRDLKLISDESSAALKNLGTTVQNTVTDKMTEFMGQVLQSPDLAKDFATHPMWQAVLENMSKTDVSESLNRVGSKISDAFTFNITNVYAGAVSVQQPVFVGGKIIASNQMADLARELSRTEYNKTEQDVLSDVERNYWQIVSIAAKKKLAETFAELLEQMESDARIAVEEGVAVQSDLLAIKVKRNEAQMLLSQASNGLALSKMLLCKQIGLPLDSQIRLSDEGDEDVPMPTLVQAVSNEEVYAARPETKMLDLASKIYDKKVVIARSDMLPKLALTGNYLISNPSAFNGFSNKFGGMFNVGVMLSVPIFHGTEALQKTKKAKVEAQMYRTRYKEACNMISLQLEQLMCKQNEAIDRLEMTRSNLECAEENLRCAMAGFAEGVVSSDVTFMAQTAWVKAHSEFIDAGVQLQTNHEELQRAQGVYSK